MKQSLFITKERNCLYCVGNIVVQFKKLNIFDTLTLSNLNRLNSKVHEYSGKVALVIHIDGTKSAVRCIHVTWMFHIDIHPALHLTETGIPDSG